MKFILYPLSLLYAFIVWLRNQCYNLDIFKSQSFQTPIISVGNITVGGTGKTPHSEYLLEMLSSHFSTAYLCRGYKRKTKGYIKGTLESDVSQIGDEPRQVLHKFNGEIPVAVCEKRVVGIQNIMADESMNAEVIVLDDAFQHRAVSPHINILLMDYNRPIYEDNLLPMGRLRESSSSKYRANIIITTKCPKKLSPIDQRIIKKRLDIRPYQDLFFTTINYSDPKPAVNRRAISAEDWKGYDVLIVTGIASADPFIQHIDEISKSNQHIEFPDHYQFKKEDIKRISKTFDEIPSTKKAIITTEKDLMRLQELPFIQQSLLENIFFIPIEITFLDNSEKLFNKKIIKYVTENRSNSKLHTK